MTRIVFGTSDATPMTAEETVGYHRAPTVPKCPGCGRFCKMTTYQEYNGTWNIWYADVTCARCGEFTEQLT